MTVSSWTHVWQIVQQAVMCPVHVAPRPPPSSKASQHVLMLTKVAEGTQYELLKWYMTPASFEGSNICVCVSLQWRQKMRKPEHMLIVKEAGEEELQNEAEAPSGGFRKMLQRGQKKEMDVRERTSGILLSDRTESEDLPFE